VVGDGRGVPAIGFEEFVAARSPALLRTAWLLRATTGMRRTSSRPRWPRPGRGGARCSTTTPRYTCARVSRTRRAPEPRPGRRGPGCARGAAGPCHGHCRAEATGQRAVVLLAAAAVAALVVLDGHRPRATPDDGADWAVEMPPDSGRPENEHVGTV